MRIIKAITYQCTNDCSVGLCTQQRGKYWRHEWKDNPPAHGGDEILGKVEVRSSGINDYDGDEMDYRSIPVSQATRKIGQMVKFEYRDGEESESSLELWTNSDGSRLFLKGGTMYYKTNENGKELIPNEPCLVFWHSKTCHHCQAMKPIVSTINSIPVVMIDCDEHSDFADQHQIMSIPVLEIRKKGQSVARKVGFMPKDELEKFIRENIYSAE